MLTLDINTGEVFIITNNKKHSHKDFIKRDENGTIIFSDTFTGLRFRQQSGKEILIEAKFDFKDENAKLIVDYDINQNVKRFTIIDENPSHIMKFTEKDNFDCMEWASDFLHCEAIKKTNFNWGNVCVGYKLCPSDSKTLYIIPIIEIILNQQQE